MKTVINHSSIQLIEKPIYGCNRESIVELLAFVFSIAQDRKINENAFNKLFYSSKIAHYLESGDDSFLFNDEETKLVEDLFGFRLREKDGKNIYVTAHWCAEAYFYLFLTTKKSFEYIMLYLPYSLMLLSFHVYHEMDWSQLLTFFHSLEDKKSLLSMLIKEKGLTIQKLAILTNISVNTLKKYCKNNVELYKASFANIYSINSILQTNINTFVSSLPIGIKEDIEKPSSINDELFARLGLFVLSFYDAKLIKTEFDYKNGYLIDITSGQKYKCYIYSPLEVVENSRYINLIIFTEHSVNDYVKDNASTLKEYKNAFIISNNEYLNYRSQKVRLLPKEIRERIPITS